VQENAYLIIAYYHLGNIENPTAEIKNHRTFFAKRDVQARIYISENGINCQMSALAQDARDYMEWMTGREGFADIKYKVDSYPTHAFPKLIIKYRKQLVAFNTKVDLSQRGQHVSPAEWKTMLEKDDNHIVLDIRNGYEWKVGRFATAECPPCETSQEFKDYALELKDKVDKQNTPVMMYCTGGIRCEFFSALLKEEGFEKVYQLDGGVINYGHKEGSKHWEGKLFVFDDRMTVPISEEPAPVVGSCHHCQEPNETYYNCANMSCNALFLCCPECLKEFGGCCQEACQHAERVRPYHHQEAHKPFRKWYTYFADMKT
jgi:UPF0176 protein